MMNDIEKLLGTLLAILVAAVIIAFPIMWLWNWLMPHLFSLPRINWLEALGLWGLIRCLIGFKLHD